MTAASSGDPGGSREQWPRLGNSTREFGSLSYLLLTSKDTEKPLKSDPFIVGKSVEDAAGGSIEGASTEAQGTRYTLRVRNQVQVNKLLKLSTLLDGTEVVVQLHPNLNVSRCVISCFEAIRMEEKDVLLGLISQGVIRVQRITRKEHGKPVNTSALILTFNRSNFPSHVKIGVLRVATRPYYPNPLLCYGCVRYGHPRVRCPGPKRCLNCSADHELAEDEQCAAAAHCINCGGPHRPNNRQCPVYKKEVEVIRLKVDHNLTYPEARKRVETGTGSYAAAAAQQTADRKKLEELEKKMEEKDAQIAQLLEVMKKKDEKIDKLMGHIKLIRTPQVQQTPLAQPSKPIHPSESQSNQAIDSNLHSQLMRKSGESQIGTPSMHLRSRSPATTESKHNKKKKRHDRSNNTSPGRQSPPLKKPVEKTPTSDQETISVDEDEIEETPPSQHLR